MFAKELANFRRKVVVKNGKEAIFYGLSTLRGLAAAHPAGAGLKVFQSRLGSLC